MLPSLPTGAKQTSSCAKAWLVKLAKNVRRGIIDLAEVDDLIMVVVIVGTWQEDYCVYGVVIVEAVWKTVCVYVVRLYVQKKTRFPQDCCESTCIYRGRQTSAVSKACRRYHSILHGKAVRGSDRLRLEAFPRGAPLFPNAYATVWRSGSNVRR